MPSRPLQFARRFLNREDGATAVEFTLVFIPFMGLVIACIQTALIFTMNQALQTATMRASRELMTGQATALGLTTSAKFLDEVYAKLPGGFDRTKLYAEVESWPNWAAYNPTVITYDAQGKPTNTSYNSGSSGGITMVKVMYDWPVFGGGFTKYIGKGDGAAGFGLSNQPDDGYLMVATTVMRNEPY